MNDVAQLVRLEAHRPAAAAWWRRRRRAARGRPALLLQVALLMTLVYFLLPLVWLVVASMKDNGQLFTTSGLALPENNQFLHNLSELFTFQDGIFRRWVLNTVIYAVCGASAATVLAAMCGFALAKYVFPGARMLRGAIFATILVPMTALAVPQFLVLSEAHLVNTYWAYLIPSCVSPFGVFLMQMYSQASVPDELMDAGRVDGLSELGIFRKIAFPLLRPGLATVFLFQLVAIWNNFLLPLLVLSDSDLFPIPLGLQVWNGSPASSHEALYSLVITGSLVSVIPLVVMFVVLQRVWQKGLTAGALVG